MSTEKKDETQSGDLPVLETKCPNCEGKCGKDDYHCWVDCEHCKGLGFIPTAAGRAILDLIRHNSRDLVREALSRILQ